MDSSLRLPLDRAALLSDWARSGYPRETCGLLIGRRNGESADVIEVVRAANRNVARARDRYELDPADQLGAEDRARELGLEVVGVWHSHPDHAAEPSEVDRAAAWEGWSYVIVSVGAEAVGEIRSWRLVGERFVEERVEP